MLEFMYIGVLLTLGTFILSVFWLFDSIVSLILSLTVFSTLLIFILFILGLEFMSLSLAVLYIGGMLILFLFISMSVGNEFRYVKSATGVGSLVIVKETSMFELEEDEDENDELVKIRKLNEGFIYPHNVVIDNKNRTVVPKLDDINSQGVINSGDVGTNVKIAHRHDILAIQDALSSKQVSLVMFTKCFIFMNITPNLIPSLSLALATEATEDDNTLYTILAESEDVKALSLLLYTEFSFHIIIIAFILYSTLIGVVSTVDGA